MQQRLIGLHMRIAQSLAEMVEKAQRLDLKTFQCFLMTQAGLRLITFTKSDIDHFIHYARPQFKELYLHVSYHANACEPYGLKVLKKELALGKQLGFSYAVLHPGSGKWCGDKQQGMRVLVDTLNKVCDAQETRMPILLENSAHGKFSVGGDIADLAVILNEVKHPEMINVCIDTAHAYAYGYNIADEYEQDRFVEQLRNAIGLDKIKLIHLNDTSKSLGGFIDQHEVYGKGNIGSKALYRFAMHPELQHVPIILEFPMIDEAVEQQSFQTVVQDLRRNA